MWFLKFCQIYPGFSRVSYGTITSTAEKVLLIFISKLIPFFITTTT